MVYILYVIPKIQIWVYFGGPWDVGKFYGHLEYVYLSHTAIWYVYGYLVILWLFGINSQILVHRTKINMATLIQKNNQT
jgi:hypothetical protein